METKSYPEIGKTYTHYKGGKYEVISLAKHTETGEDMVVYRSLLFGSVYVRPLDSWNSEPSPGIIRFSRRFSKPGVLNG